MTRKDIELLFKNESYTEAMELLRKALEDDSDNAEWVYYLFLAENGDYSNIDLSDIKCEFDFNRALRLANARLRESFQAEYNFYKAVDPALRKYFSYASRGNIEKFEQLLNSYGYKKTELIYDSSSTKDFYSNLDYLVTSRVKKEIVDLNLLALNLLYLATQDKKVLDTYNVLMERAEEIGTTLAGAKIASSLTLIKAYMDNIKKNKKVSIEDEEKRKELEKLARCLEAESKRVAAEKENLNKKEEEIRKTNAILNSKQEELERQKRIEDAKRAFFHEEEKPKPTVTKAPVYTTVTSTSSGPEYYKVYGISLKALAIINTITVIILMICAGITMGHGNKNYVTAILSVAVFVYTILLMRSTAKALKMPNKAENGAYPALICVIGTFILAFATFVYSVGA